MAADRRHWPSRHAACRAVRYVALGALNCAALSALADAQPAAGTPADTTTRPVSPPAPAPVAPGDALQVKVLIEVDYAASTDVRAQFPPYPSEGIGVRRVRLLLQGAGPLGLGYRLLFDPSPLAAGPQGASPFRGAPLVEGSVDFALPHALVVRVGQQRVPFGLNSTTGAPSLPTPEFAQFARSVQQRVSAFRDIGATVEGQAGALGYAGGVFNGAGINVLADNDSTKDVAARLTYVVRPGLQVGASGWVGHAPRQYTRAGETRPVAAFLDNADFRRYGVDARFARGPLLVTAEYARNRTAYDSAAVTPTPRRAALFQTGYNALAALRLGVLHPALRRLEVVGRYDAWDPDDALAHDEVREYVGGVNFYVFEIGAPPDARLGRALNYVRRESRLMLFLEHSRFPLPAPPTAATLATPDLPTTTQNTRVHARWSLFY